MYNQKRIMALVPARGGSKGISRKNVRLLNGIPLIAHSILEGKNSQYIDEIFVSTEDEEIAEIARQYGAKIPAMRPSELAQDNSTTLEVVLHALQAFVKADEWDALVLLQPTQPLRTAEDIDAAIESFYDHGRRGLVSISEVADSPLLIRCFGCNEELIKLLNQGSTVRRQDMPKYYRVNGAIYINAVEQINCQTSFNDNPIGYEIPISHSVDIDKEADFAMAEYYINKL